MSLIVFMRHFKTIFLFLFLFLTLSSQHAQAVDPYIQDPSDPLNADLAALARAQGDYSQQSGYGQAPSTGYPQQTSQQYSQGYQPQQMQSQYPPSTMNAMGQSQYPQQQLQGSFPLTQMNSATQYPSATAGYYGATSAMSQQASMMRPQMPMPQQMLGAENISQRLGAMTVDEAVQIFDDVTSGTSSLTAIEDFNTTLQSMEKAFNQCNFSQTASSGGISTSTLVVKAIAAITKVMSVTNSTFDKVLRGLDRAVSTDPLQDQPTGLTATEKNAEQNQWIATAYMLAAAAANPTFRTGLASHTLSKSSNFFWREHVRVFSVQPVSLRTQTLTGEFIENPIEKAFIEKLFAVETLISSAHAIDVGTKEEIAFIQGTRLLTSIIVQPRFINASIGLQEFALWIFQKGIMKWLNNLSLSQGKHDELWIVGAEAFNIMYNAVVGPSVTPPTNLAAKGVNRANSIPTDHLMCNFGKGSFCQALQRTSLTQFTTDINKLADTFTKRKLSAGSQTGLLAKNDSELQLLMMCSEASEYLLSETTAPEAANLITYHFENGFRVNNRVVNWAEVSTCIGSLTGVILDRLMQKTGTTLVIPKIGGGYKSMRGDYVTTPVYQALNQGLSTIIAVSTKIQLIGTKISSIMPTLKKAKPSLEKYMRDRNDLKTFRPRISQFMNPGSYMQPTQFNPSGLPMAGSMQYPNTMRPAITPYGMQTSYPAQTGYAQQQVRQPAYGQPTYGQQPAYGQQYSSRGY